jgi:hypothetical protein
MLGPVEQIKNPYPVRPVPTVTVALSNNKVALEDPSGGLAVMLTEWVLSGKLEIDTSVC